MLRAIPVLVVLAGCRPAPASNAPSEPMAAAEPTPPAEPTATSEPTPPAEPTAAAPTDGGAAPAYDTAEPPDDDDATGAVQLAKANVKGSLDKEVIRTVVRTHLQDVRDCYNAGLASNPQLTGRVAIQFTIGPEGNVPVAVVAQSNLPDAAVAQCVAASVKLWLFPKPRGGGNVVVTYPFVLVPG